MIQGFNWESSKTANWYDIVKSKAGDLQASQIDMIWMPPPSDAASVEGYLPRELYDLTSSYGDQAELQSCINALHNNGVKVIADIVINHRVGVTDWADFQNPTWGCWGIVANDEWGANGGNPCGNWDTGDNYGPARDIDHTNQTVQNDISAWMNWLKNTIGFDGWRYDYVRGYNGSYNGIYNNATNPYFSVGELWDNLDLNNPDPHRQQIVDWINQTQGTSAAFDFTTKGILQQAVHGELWRLNRNGGAPGVIGWWPGNSVTFLDNHDTGSTQAHWPFPGDKVMQGYAYILTHPGVPTVFWDHFYDWGLHDPIKDLIAVRKANGLHSESTLDIQVAQGDLYAAIIDGKVAMKIGPGNWAPSGSGWTLAASGNDYAVWTQGNNGGGNNGGGNNGESLTVHFKKPSNWSAATIYFWQDNNGNPTSGTSWPGETMSDADGDGWYSYTIDGNDCSSIIFSDNGANKTDDLNRCNEGWYDGTTWHDTKPSDGGGNDGGGGTSDLTVHFKKPSNWGVATIYFWQENNGNPTSGTSWPGESMTDADGDGWYTYTISGNECSNIIFSDNGANQSADLNRCGEGWYDGTTWHNSNPDAGSGGGSGSSDFTVYFKPSGYSNPSIYFWAADNGATTSWPGETMTNVGGGWYAYTFVGGNCANLIFSNNGANQTADLNRCGDGWYNGTWHSANPDAGARFGASPLQIDEPLKALTVSNYPNPFNRSTTIAFELPSTGAVSLKVYNLMGKEVATLANGELTQGMHELTFNGERLTAGIYIFRLNYADQSITGKMILKK
ncbi:MAG: starch-binding protein [Flammeovirgaceae bacterium]